MRNIQKSSGKRTTMSGTAFSSGTHRAGMHQKSEHEYQRSRMTEFTEETPEEALDMPAEMEAEIPPVEEEDDEEVQDIAEDDGTIAADPEILEEIADPEASVNEEETETNIAETLSVDWSGERIPVIEPVTGGVDCGPKECIYSSGDNEVKEIQEPLPFLGEQFGVPPLFNGIENPSANVAAPIE